MADRFESVVARLRAAVLGPQGRSDAKLRRAALDYAPQDLPEPVRRYLEILRRNAYKLTDADLQVLQDAGFTQDEVYDLTTAGALGAGLERLAIGLRAVRGES